MLPYAVNCFCMFLYLYGKNQNILIGFIYQRLPLSRYASASYLSSIVENNLSLRSWSELMK